jgi:single-stranded-DNA-specific exonuclease
MQDLLRPEQLSGIDHAASLIKAAVIKEEPILIVGDFDADGATSCALMVSQLKAMGTSRVDYLVPDRFRFGYGLSPEIVEVAAASNPSLLITVDNGIASLAGVELANQRGMNVIITDHHLPGKELPPAAAIVNPNQPGCTFPSKNLAGVGVAFYLLSAVRGQLRGEGWFDSKNEPVLADSLDLVALGTVADVVPLDHNNRTLVQEGIRRIRAGRSRPGIYALIEAANIDYRFLTTRDLAFSIGPRLNAAGRLEDMSIGIECLLADSDSSRQQATRLDEINKERRSLEADMREDALAQLEDIRYEATGGICLFNENWHQGIVGILASRVKERSQRPVIAFARVSDDELKGSARSVSGFHIRDALDGIATRHPGLLLKFGGHAMAAGLSLKADDLQIFSRAFNQSVVEKLGEAEPEQVAVTDGELGEAITADLAKALEDAAPWGHGFPEPEFDGRFEVLDQRIVGERHLKLLLQPELGEPIDAICFYEDRLLENRFIHCAYRIEVNRFRGREKPQLVVTLIV